MQNDTMQIMFMHFRGENRKKNGNKFFFNGF